MYFQNFLPEIRLTREPAKEFSSTCIKSSEDVYKEFSGLFKDFIDIYEAFFVLFLDRSNKVTAFAKISQGGTAGTVVDVKIICKKAIEVLAQGVICIHNHPSGNLKPSNADLQITEKIKSALKFFDISLLDHLIFNSAGYLSMADDDLL